jgi:hypothetical protein
MITCSELTRGRLGNQLFHVASTIGIAIANGHEYVFPEWSYSKHFCLPIPQLPRKSLNTLCKWTRYGGENRYNTNTTPFGMFLDKEHDWDLIGHNQSQKYFEHCKALVKEYLTIQTTMTCSDACAIHVRRGDYLSRRTSSHLYTTPIEYFNKAIGYFPESTNFMVFSDDIAWCKEQFRGDKFKFSEGNNDITDLTLMSMCSRGHIISNSSFSWWGAWLSNSPMKIAPSLWHKKNSNEHTIPLDWIRI